MVTAFGLLPMLLVFTGFGVHTVPAIAFTGATAAAILTGLS